VAMDGVFGNLMPLVLGAMLTWAGATKLLVRNLPDQAAASRWYIVLGDVGRATAALRTVAWVELALGLGLLQFPTSPLPAKAAVVFGIGYVACLAFVWLSRPVGWRAFARATLVVGAGLLAAGAGAPWWSAMGAQPAGAVAVILGCALVVGILSTDLDHLRLTPLRRSRLGTPRAPMTVDVGESVGGRSNPAA
jgi:hypothetical protein